MSSSKLVIYQSKDFDINAPLVLFSQHLLQSFKTKSVSVMNDLVGKGYHLCVVADRNVYKNIETKKVNFTLQYREKMKKTLMALNVPVKFALLDEFAGVKFAIDTDDFDRIDYKGPKETITVTTPEGLIKKRTVPKYVRNDFIVNYFKKNL